MTSAVIAASGTTFGGGDSSPHHVCLLSVCDCGTVTSLCADDVVVRVHVVEQRRPRFSEPHGYHFNVTENQPAGTLVGTYPSTFTVAVYYYYFVLMRSFYRPMPSVEGCLGM